MEGDYQVDHAFRSAPTSIIRRWNKVALVCSTKLVCVYVQRLSTVPVKAPRLLVSLWFNNLTPPPISLSCQEGMVECYKAMECDPEFGNAFNDLGLVSHSADVLAKRRG
jgi:hypothetical protein